MSQFTIQEAMDLALARHRAGQLAEAEGIYRLVLGQQPNHPQALHLLGLLAQQSGRSDVAVELIGRAVALDDRVAEYQVNLGVALHGLGRTAQAIESFQRAVQLRPDVPEAYANMGDALRHAGRLAESEAACRRAIELRPAYMEAYLNLGNALQDLGDLNGASAAFEEVVRLRPDFAQGYFNLGKTRAMQGRLDEAAAAQRRAIELNPGFVDAHLALGAALLASGQQEAAVQKFQQALAMNPRLPEAHCGMGLALRDLGRTDQAIHALAKAVDIQPRFTEALRHLTQTLLDSGQFAAAAEQQRKLIALRPEEARGYNELGSMYCMAGEFDEAIAQFRRSVERAPDMPSGHWNLALMLLMKGDYEQGWEEFQWRERAPALATKFQTERPRWNGEELNGKRIFLYAEQGMGDTIQFIRYSSEVARRGGKIVLACHEELLRLLRQAEGVVEAYTPPGTTPEFDVYAPLLSLPRIFKTRVETIPNGTSYLKADEAIMEAWRDRLGGAGKRLKIGLAWAGRADHSNDRNRSLKLEQLGPLADMADAAFFSLQKGAGAQEAQLPPRGMDVMDLSGQIADFADTAAVIEHLDLVISADTAVAHLAGAMGKRVWTLIPFVPDWRWMLNRADSPWYPSMRLFRQERARDWTGAVNGVTQALRSL